MCYTPTKSAITIGLDGGQPSRSSGETRPLQRSGTGRWPQLRLTDYGLYLARLPSFYFLPTDEETLQGSEEPKSTGNHASSGRSDGGGRAPEGGGRVPEEEGLHQNRDRPAGRAAEPPLLFLPPGSPLIQVRRSLRPIPFLLPYSFFALHLFYRDHTANQVKEHGRRKKKKGIGGSC